MKKLLVVGCFLFGLIAFTGCYADRAVVYQRPPVRPVIVAPAPYYYRPAPVIVERYSVRPYERGRHRIFSNRYRRY